ncbi:MAG TPA: molybdopterin-dependent oxidoreductase [Bryobacteraceae bacterium]|nr:molybdopterin-dependent oxidoreductase [Bryobacteraceae bacterium]
MALYTRKSVCALDCPDTCSVLVDIDQSGRATRLRGNPDHPITRGFLCAKVTKYLEREYHPERLLYPQRRIGAKGDGRFERVSWDEALDGIAARLQEIAAKHGSEAILPYSYAGTMGLLNGSGMDRRFFHRLGASRLDRTICSSAGGAALMLSQGAKIGMPPEQFAKAKLIIAWGANILGTNVHLWPWIVEARRNGAKFYVIDPVRNRTGALADRHYAVNPGSDLALALAMAHVILRDGLQDSDYLARYANGFPEFQRLVARYTPEKAGRWTGIPASDIEHLAHEFATTQPAAIRVNYGVQRSERGGAAVRAITALPVLTGAWRHEGGGCQLSTSGAFEFNRPALELPDLQLRSLGREARLVNMSRLGHALKELQDPPVHALVVYNSNPAAIAPHQSAVVEGLRRADLFTVVLEQFQTDTADYADYLLPVTTFLEHTDLYLAYGHYHLQLATPALARPGEVWSNVDVFRALAQRMGFDDPCFTDSEHDMIRSLLDSRSPYLQGITLERLLSEGSAPLNFGPSDAPFRPFAHGGFKTDSEKFEFGAHALAYEPPIESRFGDRRLAQRYPLEFVSAKNDDSMNSTFGHRPEVDRQTGVLVMHREDADRRQIVDGMMIKAYNDRGSCFFEARISEAVQAGVVRAHSTRWNKSSWQRLGVNQLTSDRLTDIGGGPVLYSCLVEVLAVTEPPATSRKEVRKPTRVLSLQPE